MDHAKEPPMNTEHQLSDLLVFVLGSFGAIAPEIVRLYRLRWKVLKFSHWYFIISVLYAALGGVVALLLPATTYHAAFYAGITAPVMISSVVRQRGKPTAMANEKAQFINEEEAADKMTAAHRTWKRLLQEHADGLF
jgi:hypothetical protein